MAWFEQRPPVQQIIRVCCTPAAGRFHVLGHPHARDGGRTVHRRRGVVRSRIPRVARPAASTRSRASVACSWLTVTRRRSRRAGLRRESPVSPSRSPRPAAASRDAGRAWAHQLRTCPAEPLQPYPGRAPAPSSAGVDHARTRIDGRTHSDVVVVANRPGIPIAAVTGRGATFSPAGGRGGGPTHRSEQAVTGARRCRELRPILDVWRSFDHIGQVEQREDVALEVQVPDT